MFFDSHCHLTSAEFEKDLSGVLERAAEKDLRMITSGDSLEDSRACSALAKEKSGGLPHLYAAAGFHPYCANDFSRDILAEYKNLLCRENVVALGEVGLDYYKADAPREKQKDVFRSFLDLAQEEDAPVVIHMRRSETDVLSMVPERNEGRWNGVIHCYSSDSKESALEFIRKGFMISFAGQLTYPSAKGLREVVRSIPFHALLIETDAPYLAPQAVRGKRNEPALIEHTAAALAAIREITLRDAARITLFNTHRIFRIPDKEVFRPRFVYSVRDSLYINLTNRCPCDCCFCPRRRDYSFMGYNLKLDREPEFTDILEGLQAEEQRREAVFCGLGEPTVRLDILKKTAAFLKGKGLRVRLNTNGLGSLLNARDIVPELTGLIDSVSISLNAGSRQNYEDLCKPSVNGNAFEAVLDFAKRCSGSMDVALTAVDIPEVNIEKCREISQNLDISFHAREDYFKGTEKNVI